MKAYLTRITAKSKRYGTIASVFLNVMLAIGIIGYAACAGYGYAPLPSFQSPAVDPDMQVYNTAKSALKVAERANTPVYQASYHQGDVPTRNPMPRPKAN